MNRIIFENYSERGFLERERFETYLTQRLGAEPISRVTSRNCETRGTYRLGNLVINYETEFIAGCGPEIVTVSISNQPEEFSEVVELMLRQAQRAA